MESIFVMTLPEKLLSSISEMQRFESGTRNDKKQNHVNVLFDYKSKRFIVVCMSGNPYYYVGVS